MTEQARFNPANKFVRVIELRKDGFVEFEFAIGEPELFCEMIMPASAFDEFCQINRVLFLDPHPCGEACDVKVGADGLTDQQEGGLPWNWTMRDATHRRIKPE